jgi:lipopolysaccharide/colanic/teichoic acid biosynthesis glycosyltransferase
VNFCLSKYLKIKFMLPFARFKEFAFVSKIINVLIGFLSFYLGLVFSPQLRVPRDINHDAQRYLFEGLVFGFCLSFASFVAGQRPQMIVRSKVDYFVNVLVASVFGGFGAILLIYALRFSMVGRWVFFIGVFVYATICWFFGVLWFYFGSLRLRVAAIGDSKIESVLEDVKGVINIDYIDLVKVSKNDISKFARLADKSFDKCDCIILSSELDVDSVAQIVLSFGSRAKIKNLNCFIEDEFGVVDLNTLTWSRWWDMPTNLAGDVFPVVKRALDLLVVLILAGPAVLVLTLAAFLIKIDSRGPVFYRQIRLGQFRIPFSIIKLRTMDVSAEVTGIQWAKVGDARVTRIGRILRRTRIDELPQLWNIARGEMSLIGPRPERPEFHKMIEKELPAFDLRLCCKPGLTGWAQINYPYGASVQDAKNKLLFDLYYIRNAGIKLDMQIIFRTFLAMVRGAR